MDWWMNRGAITNKLLVLFPLGSSYFGHIESVSLHDDHERCHIFCNHLCDAPLHSFCDRTGENVFILRRGQ